MWAILLCQLDGAGRHGAPNQLVNKQTSNGLLFRYYTAEVIQSIN